MKTRKMIIAAGFLLLTGCSGVLGPNEIERLRRAEEVWKSRGISEYTFEMRTGCFCPPEIAEWAVVDVKDGKVIAARSLSGAPLAGYALESRKSVEQLFEAARSYRQDWMSDVDFELDPELEYPSSVTFKSKPNIADAGLVYEARNLQIRNRVL